MMSKEIHIMLFDFLKTVFDSFRYAPHPDLDLSKDIHKIMNDNVLSQRSSIKNSGLAPMMSIPSPLSSEAYAAKKNDRLKVRSN